MSPEKLSVTIATFQNFLTRLHRHAKRRPWTELADRTAISLPESLAEAYSRVRKNTSYFRVNYLIVVAVVIAVSLLRRPFTLLLLGSLAGAWLYLYVLRHPEQQLVIFGRVFTDCEALVGLSFATVAVALWTNVVSVIISAVTVGVAVVCCHGALRVPEDRFLEQQEQRSWASGIFPDGGPVSSVGVHIGPLAV
ncbi:hypothetical protein TanjilG_21441 [Lupinus angustifolius]|uniref:PRA1 family protein n=1 Tax=Lupinus angustifolius TaxID=3871 RepID=A0A394BW42_LUPAN|nr:PREDICTED: PRA1 family protein B2-like [Lupinus angustifolius]XP_019457724.1 PREDICTED: PRA1 family protein B2-like [Lupinus angustifolius]OIW03178.1 hypothetical protein TanjilG_11815 [Lupinus angustifolius]OIW14301.1 hypothetical protein TanjilG_21441 [Lupinus angustifolius]